jgi:hypothetical protein
MPSGLITSGVWERLLLVAFRGFSEGSCRFVIHSQAQQGITASCTRMQVGCYYGVVELSQCSQPPAKLVVYSFWAAGPKLGLRSSAVAVAAHEDLVLAWL